MQNYWEILKLNPNATPEELVEVWKSLPASSQTPEMELFVKANLDPYYRETLKVYPDLNLLLPAGFFNDSTAPVAKNFRTDLFTTPINHIVEQHHKIEIGIQSGYEVRKPYLVLLNTGSYSPIHLGHLQMMEEAREHLQKSYHILGGYLSPSHDGYVSTKYQGTAALDSDIRISLCQEVLSDSSWLTVDPWEARYNSQPINFTDVILRLKKYLEHYTQLNIEIGYVFGSDNAGFTWAFIKDGVSICFERPGYELPFLTVSQDQNLDSQRHFFISAKGNTYSSKAIREGATEFLPEKIKNLYFQYKDNSAPVYSHIYLVRNDSLQCTDFIQDTQKDTLLKQFSSELKNSIQNCFMMPMNVCMLEVDQQNYYLNSEEFPHSTTGILNVDLWTSHPKQQTLAISRLFSLSDGQVFSHNLVNRPGTLPLEEQLAKIPQGEYTLIDDDIASGRTINMITQSLPEGVNITQLVALSQQSFHHELGFDISYQFHDIVDFRDFLVGSRHGGLVVKLPNGQTGRVPYIWPYISLHHRAKLPPNQELLFTLAILKANKQFFTSLETTLSINDMDPFFGNLSDYLGFDRNLTMTQWCEYHINRLSNNKN